MLIKKTPGVYIKADIASGQSISAGQLISIVDGEAVLSDNNNTNPVIGFAKKIDGGTIYIQVQGKYPYSDGASEYWLGSNGSLINSPPTDGLVQKVAHRLDNQNILIDIDKTVIIL